MYRNAYPSVQKNGMSVDANVASFVEALALIRGRLPAVKKT
jgi:hypothetical protein